MSVIRNASAPEALRLANGVSQSVFANDARKCPVAVHRNKGRPKHGLRTQQRFVPYTSPDDYPGPRFA